MDRAAGRRWDATVSGRIHDDEADTSRDVVRALLAEQCPQWAELTPHQLLTTGSDNAVWRIDPPGAASLLVRLPRTDSAARSLATELRLLPAVAGQLPVAVPRVVHAGAPSRYFPHEWAVLTWLDGEDAWTRRADLVDPHGDELAHDLAGLSRALATVTGVDVPSRVPGMRGGPLLPLLDDLEDWLTDERYDAAGLLDVAAVRRSAAESAEAAEDEVVPDRFVHGDLIPGNVLVGQGRLTAVIDWGGAGIGDAALDLVPAWAILSPRARQVFRDATGATDAAWLRGRAFALQQAVGGVLYYTPKGHELGAVMRRSLDWVLSDR